MTTATLPRITCPTWCIVTEADHQADLDNWEGRVLHHGAGTPDGWRLSSITFVDGQPSHNDSEESVMVYDGSDTITLGEAHRRATAILATVAEAGGTARNIAVARS